MNLLPSIYSIQPIVWRSRLTYGSTKAQEEAVVLTGMAFSRDRLSFRTDRMTSAQDYAFSCTPTAEPLQV